MGNSGKSPPVSLLPRISSPLGMPEAPAIILAVQCARRFDRHPASACGGQRVVTPHSGFTFPMMSCAGGWRR